MPRYHGYQALVKKTAIFKEAFCPEFFQSHDCALAFCQVRIWTSSMPKISDVTQKLSVKWLFKGAPIQEIFHFRNSKFSFFAQFSTHSCYHRLKIHHVPSKCIYGFACVSLRRNMVFLEWKLYIIFSIFENALNQSFLTQSF